MLKLSAFVEIVAATITDTKTPISGRPIKGLTGIGSSDQSACQAITNPEPNHTTRPISVSQRDRLDLVDGGTSATRTA